MPVACCRYAEGRGDGASYAQLCAELRTFSASIISKDRVSALVADLMNASQPVRDVFSQVVLWVT